MSIIMIEGIFIITLAIPVLFKFKNYLYHKQGLIVKQGEEYAVLIMFASAMLILGRIYASEFLYSMSVPFLFWLLYNMIKFDIQLWKDFLKIKRRNE